MRIIKVEKHFNQARLHVFFLSVSLSRPQHGHSHFTPAENQENSLHNGDILDKKDSIIMTGINTIATDKSNPNPEPSQVRAPAHVICDRSLNRTVRLTCYVDLQSNQPCAQLSFIQ